jgi:hypothetical protein
MLQSGTIYAQGWRMFTVGAVAEGSHSQPNVRIEGQLGPMRRLN